MALSIDWGTRVITVPKADLTVIQLTPSEIYELNLNTFRLWLKDIEDDEVGMPHPDTHRHNTEVTIGGLTYARTIEMINGYTVTFEDGQYAVNLVGANSNVADVTNVNQVSIRPQNSAGLINIPSVEYSSYNGGVTVDVTSSNTGTIFPTGTPQAPVNNMTDALLIADYRGLTTFFILGDITLDSGLDYSDYVFVGESMSRSRITVSDAANVDNCEFYEAHVLGTLDGNSLLQHCRVSDLNYVYGVIEQCLLDPGNIVLGGNNQAVFLDCWSGNEDIDTGGLQYPTIDLGGLGQPLTIRNYNGYLSIKNKSGMDHVCVDMNSGFLRIQDTVTSGVLDMRGVGYYVYEGTGATINDTYLLSPNSIADGVLDEIVEGSVTMRQALRAFLSTLVGLSNGGNTTNIKFRDLADTKNRIDEIVDANGNRTNVTLDLS